jgi:hypothetical protein
MFLAAEPRTTEIAPDRVMARRLLDQAAWFLTTS